jgi:hypothetical protein
MRKALALLLLASAHADAEDLLHLAGSVRVLLEERCHECHGSHLERPDGKFGYVLDLQRVADNPKFIVRGDPKKSEFYRQLVDGEMPPDDHPKTPRLTPPEYDLVRRWIVAGAPSALPAVLPKLVKTPPGEPGTDATAAKDLAARKRLTIEMKRRPAGEIVAEIATRSGLRVDYEKPAREPVLSIALKKGTVLEALDYLALCGNFALTFDAGAARLGPNPPPQPSPVQPPKKRQQ